jgi:hypothetical protein
MDVELILDAPGWGGGVEAALFLDGFALYYVVGE